MPRILIIEDNEGYLHSLKTEFGLSGFDVIVAVDAEKGIELAKEEKPDAILLDIILPKHLGLTVLRELKKDKTTQNIPVFATSSYVDGENQEKALKLGAVAFLPKDKYDVPHIVERIKSHLERTKPQPEK